MKTLTDEQFKEIYTNKKLRNAVAYAHGCLSSNMEFKHFRAMNYPNDYAVNQNQINKAKEEVARDKVKTVANIGNKLVFVGMGMNYEPRYKGDICNHRIRTEITNSEGHRFFIEVGTGLQNSMRVDHSIDRTVQDELNDHTQQNKFYNYGGIERTKKALKFTKQNVLKLVNKTFGCNFTEIEVDYYTLTTEDYQSVSK